MQGVKLSCKREDPLTAGRCDIDFTSIEDLERHEFNIHEGNFFCLSCENTTFSRIFYLSQHLMYDHGYLVLPGTFTKRPICASWVPYWSDAVKKHALERHIFFNHPDAKSCIRFDHTIANKRMRYSIHISLSTVTKYFT